MFSINVTRLGRDGNRRRRGGNHPALPRWKTLGIHVFLDGAPVDSQFRFNRSKRHPLAPGFPDRLPSLLLEERRLTRGGCCSLAGSGHVSMIILGSLSSSGRECNGSRVAVQRSPKPSTPEVGTVTLAERRWPLRRNTGLGAADHRPQGRRRLGEVPFQRNKPGLRLGIVTGQGGVKLGDYRDAGVFRKGHHLGNVNAVPIVPQLFRQGRGHPRRRPS